MLGEEMKCKSDPCENVCPDEHTTDHWASGTCGTDYCGFWKETRCGVCGWYSTDCRCMSCNGYSKITERQWNALYKRRKH